MGPRESADGRRRRRALLLGAAGLILFATCMLAVPAQVSAGSPPVAIIASPLNNTAWEAGKPIPFSANGSFDPDTNLSSYPMYYRWDFPAETLEGVNLKVFNYTNLTNPGNYTVQLTVTDNESLEGYANVTVRILPPNGVPSAVIAAPANGTRYFTTDFITFNGTGSTDPEGSALAYTWVLDGSSQLGTGEQISVKLPAGNHTVTLRVQDDHGAEGTTYVLVEVVVNTPPRLVSPAVQPANGTEGDAFTFTVVYFEDNGEPAANVSLVLDGAVHPVTAAGSQAPQDGVPYAITLVPAAGAHSFYFLASDGSQFNVSQTVAGPAIWQPIELRSADELALLRGSVVPPYSLDFSAPPGSLPPAPDGYVAVSGAYAIAGSALNASALELTISFSSPLDVRRSSASAYALSSNGSAWNGVVAEIDAARGTVHLTVLPSQLPLTVRIFAQPGAAPGNAPPTLAVTFSGDAVPNETVTFDASGSSDPEGAALQLAWRFAGPGLDTEWVSGERVDLTFPQPGTYVVYLRGQDGAGNTAFSNTTITILSNEPPNITPPDDRVVLASLAVAVAVSAVLAVWWRSRTPAPTRTYDDLYGRAYKERMWDEREYAELFHKFADTPPAGGPAQKPEDGGGKQDE